MQERVHKFKWRKNGMSAAIMDEQKKWVV
jgi:hypothetical protein